MTLSELIEFLQHFENKDINVFIMGEGGFYTPCSEDSGIGADESGEEMFILCPAMATVKNLKWMLSRKILK